MRRERLLGVGLCALLLPACGGGEPEVRERVKQGSPAWVGAVDCRRVTVIFGDHWVCRLHDRQGRPCRIEAWWSEEHERLRFEVRGAVTRDQRFKPLCRG